MRTIVAYNEWVYGATSDPRSAISTWTMEIVGHVVSRSQSSVLDVRTACERSRLRTCPKALVQFNELERLLNRQPKDKGKTQNCTDPTRHLVDRFHGVVVGTTGRVLRACIVCRMAEEQRGDARGTKSVRWVPWQQTSAERAQSNLVNLACVASVRLTGTVMEPREDNACWFCIGREVKLARCGFSVDCEECREAALGEKVLRAHGKDCRDRIRVDTKCNDAGQERHAQESQDEEMTEACMTNNAEKETQASGLSNLGKIRRKRSVQWRKATRQ